MKPDETASPSGQPNQETPPALLTAVRVGRRKAEPGASGKAGDLTQKLGADVPAAASPPELPPAAPAGSPGPASPRAGPVPLPTGPIAQAPAAEPPPDTAPPSLKPRPQARLLGEDEIRELLDPPERRAAAQPASASTPEPESPAPTPREAEPAPEPAAAAPRPSLMVEPGERDAVPPAPAAPELRLVTEAPPRDAKAAAPGAGQPSVAPLSSIDQVIDYWDGLRGDRAFPPLEKLDRAHVGRTWPNCLLVAYGASDSLAPRLTRLGEENGEIEYLEMVIHWILSRGRIAARKGEPMEEEKRFPVTGGNARYQLLLLPLATPEGKSEHVLCHLTHVKEATKPKGFKRWLAS